MIEKINEILQRIVKLDEGITIDEKTIILRDLDVDSMQLVSLVCAVEDEFDIEITDKEIKRIITIGDLINYIQACQ
ncbi:MAG: acyl carrier protein [Clostridia bacterium]|nr:acyl carrier protein [Clostridia bacterium]